MRILAIETASEACSVALFHGDDLIAHDHQVLGRGHAERLVPMIASLPEKGRADRILVSLGPGSFTGVRIGIATARALGLAWKARVEGYPTLALVALQAWKDRARPVTVCMNGGHGEYFIQHFAPDGPISQEQSLTPEAAVLEVRGDCIIGNRAEQLAAIMDNPPQAIDALPDARDAIALPPTWIASDLAPIYGRAPDAVPQASNQAGKS